MNEDVELVLDVTEEKMQNSIAHLETALLKIRAGKATPSMLNGVFVDYYGVNTALNQVANVGTSDARTIVIQPWEKLISNTKLLKEGQEVEVVFHADTETPLTCELPPFVEMEITYTEPGLKGDTASSSALKSATVETGAEINVPLFINTGDKIKIDTRDNSYSERVK